VGPTADVDAVARRKDPMPYQELNPGCPARSLVTIQTELNI